MHSVIDNCMHSMYVRISIPTMILVQLCATLTSLSFFLNIRRILIGRGQTMQSSTRSCSAARYALSSIVHNVFI